MGLPSLLRQTFPSLTLSLAHLLSLLSLPLLHTLLLHHLHFLYPATLVLLQHASILLSLLFWSLFGLFKPFPYSPRSLLPLALTALPATLLPTLALARSSLALTHSARLLAPPLVYLYRHNPTLSSTISLICASAGFALFALSDPTLSAAPILLALLAGLAPAFHHLRHTTLLAATHGSELQLQLAVRVLLTFLLLPLTPLLDDYHPRSPASIFAYEWDEGATILVLSTGLLAFFAFVAQRASAARLHASAYVAITHLVSLCVFAAHFVVFKHPFEAMQALAVALVMTGAIIVGDEEAEMVRRREMARRRTESREEGGVLEGYSDEEVMFGALEERRQARRIRGNAWHEQLRVVVDDLMSVASR